MHKILIAGHSHVLALLRGYEIRLGRCDLPSDLELIFLLTDFPGAVVQCRSSSGGVMDHHLLAPVPAVVDEIEPTHVALMWSGNQLNVRALLLTGSSFDVVLPSDNEIPIDPAVELVPCSVVESYVRNTLDGDAVLGNLLVGAAARDAAVCLLGPPPPLPESAVRERLAQSPHFAAVMSQMHLAVAEAQIVPDDVRRRMRTIAIDAYRKFAQSRGAEFLPPPVAAADDTGMLGAPYWGTDATHGNGEYGAMYLEDVLAWANGDRRG